MHTNGIIVVVLTLLTLLCWLITKQSGQLWSDGGSENAFMTEEFIAPRLSPGCTFCVLSAAAAPDASLQVCGHGLNAVDKISLLTSNCVRETNNHFDFTMQSIFTLLEIYMYTGIR